MESHKICIICDQPGVKPCLDCTGPLRNPATGGTMYHERWYCSAGCEEDDKEEHSCGMWSDRIISHLGNRAGAVAQTLFFALVSKTWTFPFDETRVSGWNRKDLIHVYVPKAKHPEYDLAEGWFTKFDLGKFDQAKAFGYEEPETALLADRNSVWAFVAAHHVVMAMFETLCNDVMTDIKEVTHTLVPGIDRICTYHQSSSSFAPHQRTDQIYDDSEHGVGVYEITLKNGNRIALDLCGLQFNIPNHNPVLPWNEYWSRYGGEIVQRSPLGTTWNNHRQLLTKFDKFSHLSISTSIVNQFGRWIESFKYEHKINPLTIILWQKEDWKYRQIANGLYVRANAFLDNAVTSISKDATSLDFPVPQNGIRHPNFHDDTESVFYQNGHFMNLGGPSVADFDWDAIKDLAKDPKTPLADMKEARELLAYRCIWAPWGDHRTILCGSIPLGVEPDRFSVNPHWNSSRERNL